MDDKETIEEVIWKEYNDFYNNIVAGEYDTHYNIPRSVKIKVLGEERYYQYLKDLNDYCGGMLFRD